MYEASSDARKRTAWATSSTRPSRFIGTAPIILARQVGSALPLDDRMGGSIPGCTELTRMPSPAYCTAGRLGRDAHRALGRVVRHVDRLLADEARDRGAVD